MAFSTANNYVSPEVDEYYVKNSSYAPPIVFPDHMVNSSGNWGAAGYW